MLTFIIIYVLSFIASYAYVYLSFFTKNGIWKILTPEINDFIFTIMPVFNTFYSIVAWILFYPIENTVKDKSSFTIKFFTLIFKSKKS